MISRTQSRSGTDAEWHALNPVLAKGDTAFVEDLGKFKIGDGVTRYRALPFGGASVPEPLKMSQKRSCFVHCNAVPAVTVPETGTRNYRHYMDLSTAVVTSPDDYWRKSGAGELFPMTIREDGNLYYPDDYDGSVSITLQANAEPLDTIAVGSGLVGISLNNPNMETLFTFDSQGAANCWGTAVDECFGDTGSYIVPYGCNISASEAWKYTIAYLYIVEF